MPVAKLLLRSVIFRHNHGPRPLTHWLPILFLATLIGGCSTIDAMFSRTPQKEESITIPKKQYDALLQKNTDLKNKVRKLEGKNTAMEDRVESQKVILLFGGKIKYIVDTAAAMDYEDAIVTKMLKNSDFKEAMDRGGDEADFALVAVLKEISPEDRHLTRSEVRRYLNHIRK